MVVRVFLGISEGGLMPAFLVILSRFYTKKEAVLRIAIFACKPSLHTGCTLLICAPYKASATIAGLFGGGKFPVKISYPKLIYVEQQSLRCMSLVFLVPTMDRSCLRLRLPQYGKCTVDQQREWRLSTV